MGGESSSLLDKASQKFGNGLFIEDRSDATSFDLLSKFEEKSTRAVKHLGLLTVLKHRKSGELIFFKTYESGSLSQTARVEQNFKKLLQQGHPNTHQLKYTLHKKAEGLISDSFKLMLFLDYVSTDLEDELHRRAKQGNRFKQNELAAILFDATEGAVFLQKNGVSVTYMRLENILVGSQNSKPVIKLINASLAPVQSNLETARNSGRVHYALSPEEARDLASDRPPDHRKAPVFSLALSIVQLALLRECSLLDDIALRQTPNQSKIGLWLGSLREYYSAELYLLLREMLEFDQKKRMSLRELQLRLEKCEPFARPQSFTVLGERKTEKEEDSFRTKTAMNISMKGEGQAGQSGIMRKAVDTSGLMSGMSKLYRTDRQSKGKEVYQSGASFVGSVKNGQRNGLGKFVFPDGSFYNGEWAEDKMTGHGTLTSKHGEVVYEGDFQQGLFHGMGKFYNLEPDREPTSKDRLDLNNWLNYEGDFSRGQKCGYGTQLYWDSSRYEGRFKKDLPNGQGRLRLKGGEEVAGVWVEGRPKAS